MVELEHSDIIQIDATVITGVLVLLSLSLGLPETAETIRLGLTG